jgi:hypothetical protein
MFNKFQHFVSSKRCGRRLCRFFSLPWWFWTRTETSAGPVSSRASDTGRDITQQRVHVEVKNDLWYVRDWNHEKCDLKFRFSRLNFAGLPPWTYETLTWTTALWSKHVETVSHVLNFASYPRKQCWVKTLNHAHATSERDCLAGASIRLDLLVGQPWFLNHDCGPMRFQFPNRAFFF